MPKPAGHKATPKNKKIKNRARLLKSAQTAVVLATPEPLTYEEAQKMVQVEVCGEALRVNINDTLKIYSKKDFTNDDDSGIEIKEEKEDKFPLPEPAYKQLPGYQICDAPPRPNAYIRFIEKSVEELDGEVEYDVDEEDTAWLSIVNKMREESGLTPVSVDSLELLMDRLEKESYFQATANGQTGSVVDDDAVCCICMDGECQNTNVILFCDMCNLAVHQDCYGVPYIPEGQWLCRRCLQSPSRAVDCVLCPNQGGAFKQTDKSLWAHVVCALWIPEVRFMNTVFLEPIDSIEMIPPARWRLICYICKQKNVGACIQCHKNNCYSAFHVTCAQSAGLYMNMDTVKNSGGESQPVLVQKIAYCDAHSPADFNEERKEDVKQKMKAARKMLAKKRGAVPVILIPTIPTDRIQEIGSLVTIQKKSQFIQKLIAYWTLKRQYRNGVPLLRRLQSAQGGTRDSNTSNVDTIELCRQLKYWQCLRQDLERARLLCELVRKREKLKLEQIKSTERCWNVQFKPLNASLNKLLSLIASKDTNEIFTEPVDLEEVPDYITVVTQPMDLSKMREKLEKGEYETIDGMEKDFELMINNCFEYNDKDTVFYKAAIKMRDQGTALFKQARKELEDAGLLMNPAAIKVKESPEQSIKVDNEPEEEDIKPITLGEGETLGAVLKSEYEALKGKTGPDARAKLEALLLKCQHIKHNLQRAKITKQFKAELQRVKRLMTQANSSQAESSQSQSDHETEIQSKPISINSSVGTSPTGVNRRTAVLLTRKAQAAFKKPVDEKDQESTASSKSKKSKLKNLPVHPNPKESPKDDQAESDLVMPDSFRIYRTRHKSSGEEDSDSCTSLSTCYSHELSEIDSDDSSGEETSSDVPPTDVEAPQDKEELVLKPLQLVWAKCRGYPWYPALIIDPEIPKGFVHHGVPLPSPPSEVLSLRENHSEEVYLVLFFDAKRTWQWLPPEKLEMLGIDKEKDDSKVNEPRKPTDRKAVRKAYKDAQQYISQVSAAEEEM